MILLLLGEKAGVPQNPKTPLILYLFVFYIQLSFKEMKKMENLDSANQGPQKKVYYTINYRYNLPQSVAVKASV